MTAKPYQLGILLVHGIGTQPAGETITSWGDTLVKTIAEATNRRVNAVVERAGSDLEGGDGERMEAVLKLSSPLSRRERGSGGEDRRERGSGGEDGGEAWLLAEGWWAESFIAPSY